MAFAKKSLGQHFLTNENTAAQIAGALSGISAQQPVLEIGPGKGVLTKYLYPKLKQQYFAVELDQRMIPILHQKFPELSERLFNEDILDFDFAKLESNEINIIGNFPYNISSQIMFKVFENRFSILQVVGMFQKEVARRIVSASGNKEYGILSVLIQAFYNAEYLFDVGPENFQPRPKVNSGVIRLRKKKKQPAIHDTQMLKKLLKAGFGQRRKTLRNGLKQILHDRIKMDDAIFDKRAEQLSVGEWIDLSNRIATL